MTWLFPECHVLIQEDEARNEGEGEGLDSPVDVEFPYNSSYLGKALQHLHMITGQILIMR